MKSLISRPVVRSAARPAAHPAARPAGALALCTALLLAVMLALPGPAQAHDTLLSTDPADGSTLETSPEEIALTFSSEILDVSPLVRISDESGAEVAEIVPTVEGPTATATLPEPLPAGTYDIQWRVVSGDGHPIEGTLTLTIEQGSETAAPSDGGGEAADGGTDEGAGEGADASPQEGSSATEGEASPTAAATTAGTAGTAEAVPQDEGLSMPVLLGILAVIVVGAAIAGVAIVRRRD